MTEFGTPDIIDEERTAIVAEALQRLESDESEIIVQLYFLGRSLEEISRRSGRQRHRLYTLHRRALSKLRWCLQPYAAQRYGLPVKRPECPLCDSPYCEEINELIRNRDRTRTWKPVLDEIRDKYGIDMRGPQRLIGHERYHMIAVDPAFLEGVLQ